MDAQHIESIHFRPGASEVNVTWYHREAREMDHFTLDAAPILTAMLELMLDEEWSNDHG